MEQKIFSIIADSGIHARPAAVLVQTAGRYTANISLVYNEKKVNLKSILGVMGLGIGKGAEVTVEADGQDEKEALEALTELMKKEGLVHQ